MVSCTSIFYKFLYQEYKRFFIFLVQFIVASVRFIFYLAFFHVILRIQFARKPFEIVVPQAVLSIRKEKFGRAFVWCLVFVFVSQEKDFSSEFLICHEKIFSEIYHSSSLAVLNLMLRKI